MIWLQLKSDDVTVDVKAKKSENKTFDKQIQKII